MLSVRFLFIGEGPSDNELAAHLERCCILAGADEASGVAPDLSRLPEPVGHTVSAKLEAALQLEPEVDFAFLHRDADSRNPEPRYEEIHQAVQEVSTKLRYVAVVPVQETEAWLLLDESEIRRVAENPGGNSTLSTPDPVTVENITDPKAQLAESILNASETTGRRRERMKKKFSRNRKLLIRGLDPDGLVREVPTWARMFSDLKSLVNGLK